RSQQNPTVRRRHREREEEGRGSRQRRGSREPPRGGGADRRRARAGEAPVTRRRRLPPLPQAYRELADDYVPVPSPSRPSLLRLAPSPQASPSLMAAPRPTEFSQNLARWVLQRSIPSVVHVTYNAKRKKAVLKHMKSMDPGEVTEAWEEKREELSNQERCATGFIVGEGPDRMFVLTCAHALDHVFDSFTPISVQKINELFKITILCDHAERSHRLQVPALVCQVDCQRDLLLIHVELSELTKSCQEPHPPLPLAPSSPDSLDKVVVVSWPPYRPRTASVGETSCNRREYNDVFRDYLDAYSMRLSEVGVLADAGSSGAPMLDGDVNVAGVLHGGAQSSMCYFISLEDVRNALTAWEVI
ncbi:unnamed protein product, partial [Urochloa humidicola]